MRLPIGKKIKALRLASELTQAELATRARLTKGFISQVERDQTSISLDSLLDILDALGVGIGEFFGKIHQPQVNYSPADRVEVKERNVQSFAMLIPGSTNNLMDPIMVTLGPGESLPEETPHSGEEFGYILSGTMTLRIGKQTYKLGPKNCFYFEAHQTHQFDNRGKNPVNFLWVTSPPQM